MHLSKDMLFKGCLLSSIAHAIMTNVYPELSYEQSWDGNNFSVNNSGGVRGTISFDKDICVCAIRDDNTCDQFFADEIMKILESFPEKERKLALNETLQYLLLDGKNGVEPCITSMFWIDTDKICYSDYVAKNIRKDISLLEYFVLPANLAITKIQKYYNMNSDSLLLLNYLYKMKLEHPTEPIRMSISMAKLLPGNEINDECKESLLELNIFV